MSDGRSCREAQPPPSRGNDAATKVLMGLMPSLAHLEVLSENFRDRLPQAQVKQWRACCRLVLVCRQSDYSPALSLHGELSHMRKARVHPAPPSGHAQMQELQGLPACPPVSTPAPTSHQGRVCKMKNAASQAQVKPVLPVNRAQAMQACRARQARCLARVALRCCSK